MLGVVVFLWRMMREALRASPLLASWGPLSEISAQGQRQCENATTCDPWLPERDPRVDAYVHSILQALS